MKRDFTNENFEHFLKHSADNFRLKAPDKVWQNLSKELHKKRRRFIFGLGTFLLISSAVSYYVITNVSIPPDVSAKQVNQQPINPKPSKEQSIVTLPISPVALNNSLSATPILSNHQPTISSYRQLSTIALNRSTTTSPGTSVTESAPTEESFTPTVVDSYNDFDEHPTAKEEAKPLKRIADLSPLTIESIINSYKRKSTKAHIETQFYFTPTISYRKLTENKSYLRSLDAASVPSNYPALYSSVNSNVTHKPDLGFELGYSIKYPVSKKLKIRSGLQFNVNRYDVKAFSSPLSIATIALNTNGGRRVDSFNTVSGYSNVNGYQSNWLQNFSFQVSAPIGVEYLISENNKVQFGVATTVQPTYVLGDRAYLISTDYKNYTLVPWLVRRWNVNTAFETFIVYNTGKTKWQVGPQVRYQLLSSFVSKYPVKENLFDFGLKLGVSLSK